MQPSQCAFRQTEPVVQSVHERGTDRHGPQRERFDRIVHMRIDCRRIISVHLLWIGERIVFGDIEELHGVKVASLVDSIRTGGFVPG